MTSSIMLAQLASTLAMTGIIWFVQIVHYPLFSRVGVDHFQLYERENTRVTTWVVAPLMLVELSAALLLCCFPSGVLGFAILVWNLISVAVIWLVTFSVQVPQHTRLSASFDALTHHRLVIGTWLRTALWTGRAWLVLWMVNQLLQDAKIIPGSGEF